MALMQKPTGTSPEDNTEADMTDLHEESGGLEPNVTLSTPVMNTQPLPEMGFIETAMSAGASTQIQ